MALWCRMDHEESLCLLGVFPPLEGDSVCWDGLVEAMIVAKLCQN